MSFILDALKKSESDRQRQTGPALFEVKIAPPKSRFPVWAVAIAAMLAANAVIGGWLLLRHSSRAEEAAQPAAVAQQPGAASSSAAAPSPVAAPAAPVSAPVTATASPSAPSSPVTPPTQIAAAGAPPAAGTAAPQNGPPARPPADAPVSSPAIGAGGRGEPTLAPSAKGAQPGPVPESPGGNPDDYALAAEPTPSRLGSHVKVGTSSGYVLYQDAAVVPGANIPALRLDLHVYAPKPEERFALVNMHKVREGDTLPEGVRVEAITPDGVVMSHNGMKFLLPRQ